MAFISYEQREDFQDDTFKMVAGLVARAIDAQGHKDLESLFTSVDAIYTILWKRIRHEGFEEELEELRAQLYAPDEVDPYTKSRQLDRARKLWKVLAGSLDDGGLLLRERLDKSELVTRE
jgi:hypothetical protein